MWWLVNAVIRSQQIFSPVSPPGVMTPYFSWKLRLSQIELFKALLVNGTWLTVLVPTASNECFIFNTAQPTA